MVPAVTGSLATGACGLATVSQPYWKPFAESSLPRFIATGMSVWDQISPNFELSFDNIDSFLAVGRPHGVLGIINTGWTDDIAVLTRPAFPGLAYCASAAWQANPVDRGAFFSDYARIVYPAAAAEVSAGLIAVGRAEVELAKSNRAHQLTQHKPDQFISKHPQVDEKRAPPLRALQEQYL